MEVRLGFEAADHLKRSKSDRGAFISSARLAARFLPIRAQQRSHYGCQQLYTPAAQRRVVRRATPATLTGVNGRPTLASAEVMAPNASVLALSITV
jgi:hypothetical protein